LIRPVLLALLLGAVVEPAPGADYPELDALHPSDPLFRQQQQDVSIFYQAWATGREFPPLSIFRYELSEEEDFLAVAARTSLPQATIATLNRLNRNEFPPELKTVLVPNLPGIFVPETPRTDLEHMVAARDRDRSLSFPVTVSVRGEPTRFRFYPGTNFDRSERTGFLNVLFRPPVSIRRVTSPFGLRRSPINGRYLFHRGTDLGAPHGSAVVAARDGRVTDTGIHPVYGLYVLIKHEHDYETFYAHLDEVLVELNQQINSGMVVGTVGTSGLTTGPHLHFEIRVRGEPRDPMRYLRGD
jgi:murein DD-endopeptidase MepM/ murein hydrolase activator NlpD